MSFALDRPAAGAATDQALGADPAAGTDRTDSQKLIRQLAALASEELCFRVGGYGILYLVARAALAGLGAQGRLGDAAAEGVGLLGSSLVFAAAHLRRFTAWLGPGGAEFDPTRFTWLVLAGILLGLIFRLRGPGVAAWAHGLFNVALLVGVDPDVIL